MCDADLPISAGLFGALLAIVAIAAGKPRSRTRALALVSIGGLAGAALLYMLAVDGGALLNG